MGKPQLLALPNEPPSLSLHLLCPASLHRMRTEETPQGQLQIKTYPKLHLNLLQTYLSGSTSPLSPTKRKRTLFSAWGRCLIQLQAGQYQHHRDHSAATLSPTECQSPSPVRPSVAVEAALPPSNMLHAAGGAPALQPSVLLVATQLLQATGSTMGWHQSQHHGQPGVQ